MRQVVLDTETTGLAWERGHRVIEIGCIELVKRRPTGRQFQRYLNPDRAIDAGAMEVTGISNEFLLDKPRFPEVVDEFLDFIRDAELIIHNAAFDVGFLDNELNLAGRGLGRIGDYASVVDSLLLARERYPGQRNSLDALCKRLGVDNAHRTLHGALLDAQLLTEVYLTLTGGQGDLGLSLASDAAPTRALDSSLATGLPRKPRKVLRASEPERELHAARLQKIAGKSSGDCVWLRGGNDEDRGD